MSGVNPQEGAYLVSGYVRLELDVHAHIVHTVRRARTHVYTCALYHVFVVCGLCACTVCGRVVVGT